MLIESATGFSLADLNSAKTIKVAETVSKGAFFIDSNGNIITGEVIAIAPMEANTEYTPVMTKAMKAIIRTAAAPAMVVKSEIYSGLFLFPH